MINNIIHTRRVIPVLLVSVLSLCLRPAAQAFTQSGTAQNPAWSGFTITKYVWGQRQDGHNYCGPASGQTMLSHDLGDKTPSQKSLASAMGWDSDSGVTVWGLRNGVNKYTPKRKYQSYVGINLTNAPEWLYQNTKNRIGAKGETASILVEANIFGLSTSKGGHWITITGYSPNYNTHHTWQVWDNREQYGNYHHLRVSDWSNYFQWGVAWAVLPTE